MIPHEHSASFPASLPASLPHSLPPSLPPSLPHSIPPPPGRAFYCQWIGTPMSFLGPWWTTFGVSASAILSGVVYWHSHRHVCRIAIVPGVMDQIILTTHNMLGEAILRRMRF